MSSYWSYPFKPPIKPEFQLDLGQGNTPLQEITELVKSNYIQFPNDSRFFLKREDLNPNGSFKDRALAYQISHLQQQRIKYCVISSSGNAAISCAAFCQKTNIKPIILISPDTPSHKLSQIIKKKPFILIQSHYARRLAAYISKKYHIHLLNPSCDDLAISGFETLGWEINKQLPNCDAIFSYCTSGASILGIYEYYYKQTNIYLPQIVGVQSGQQTFLANLFDQNFENEKQIAGLNTPHKSKRSKEIYSELVLKFPPDNINNPKISIPNLKHTRGLISWVKNQDIKEAQKFLKNQQINSSFEGSASLAASIKFANYTELKNIAVVISGIEYDLVNISQNYQIYNINDKQGVDQLLHNLNISK